MPDAAGLSDETTGEIVMPPGINLSSANMVPYGLYLMRFRSLLMMSLVFRKRPN